MKDRHAEKRAVLIVNAVYTSRGENIFYTALPAEAAEKVLGRLGTYTRNGRDPENPHWEFTLNKLFGIKQVDGRFIDAIFSKRNRRETVAGIDIYGRLWMEADKPRIVGENPLKIMLKRKSPRSSTPSLAYRG